MAFPLFEMLPALAEMPLEGLFFFAGLWHIYERRA
jgi:hypothetical protein